jgi:hypothetical protein
MNSQTSTKRFSFTNSNYAILSLLLSFSSIVLCLILGFVIVQMKIQSSISEYMSNIFTMFIFFVNNLTAKRILLLGVYMTFSFILPFAAFLISVKCLQKDKKSILSISAVLVSSILIIIYLCNFLFK